MWMMGTFFVLFTAFSLFLELHDHPPLFAFLEMYLPIALMLGGMFYILGVVEYQEGRAPITEQEIEQRRQEERTRLFRQAQGYIPFMGRPWFLSLLIGVGVFFAVVGVLCFIFPVVPSIWGIIYGAAFLFCAMLLFLTAWRIHQRSKYLASDSARWLSRRLMMGEITEGSADNEEYEN